MTRFAAFGRHPLTLAGVVVATASGIGFVVLVIAVLAGLFDHPYAGLVVAVALPAMLVLGLLLIPAGRWLERRARARHGGAGHDRPVLDFRQARVRRTALVIALLTAVNIVVVLLGSYAALRRMESPAFCGQACHTPMQPQFVAWRDSVHAGTTCVQCHIGEGASAFVHAKLAGVRQLAHVLTNSYARPTPPGAEMPPGAQAQTCLGCHRPTRPSADRIIVIREYADDETNAETATMLQMRLGAIHWHADPANRVEYVATGAASETIPYVKVTRPDGQVREYVTADATDQIIRDGTRRTMDCIDCHTTVGHPIAPTAERAVDEAMAAGLVSRQLPHVRREAVRLMKASYAGEAEAEDTIEREFRGFYQSRGGAIDEPAVSRTVAALQALYRRNVFPDMKVTWGSYPDNRGHLTLAGCFRCHDDSHTDKTGAAIRADCELCHRQVVAPD